MFSMTGNSMFRLHFCEQLHIKIHTPKNTITREIFYKHPKGL